MADPRPDPAQLTREAYALLREGKHDEALRVAATLEELCYTSCFEIANRCKRFEAALELLDPLQRETIILHDWEGLSFGQMAERLSSSKSEVRRAYLRAIDALIVQVEALREGRWDDIAELTGLESDCGEAVHERAL